MLTKACRHTYVNGKYIEKTQEQGTEHFQNGTIVLKIACFFSWSPVELMEKAINTFLVKGFKH